MRGVLPKNDPNVKKTRYRLSVNDGQYITTMMLAHNNAPTEEEQEIYPDGTIISCPECIANEVTNRRCGHATSQTASMHARIRVCCVMSTALGPIC